MAIRHITLPLTGEEENTSVATYGLRLARQLTAHISGCYEDDLGPLYAPPGDLTMPPVSYGIFFNSMQKLRKEREAHARKQFELAAQAMGLPLSSGPVSGHASAAWSHGNDGKACAFDIMTDLVVTATPGVAAGPLAWNVIEHALFAARRLLVVVPPSVQQVHFDRPLIAWNGSREAENAVERSLELLKPGVKIAIAQCGPTRLGRMPLRRLSDYLHCHGFVPVEEDMEGRVGSVEDVIYHHAQALRCDCIIMGAYSHSRTRELLLGGMTDFMLRHSHIPLVLSH